MRDQRQGLVSVGKVAKNHLLMGQKKTKVGREGHTALSPPRYHVSTY